MKRALVLTLIVLALIGVADSSYLAARHYSGEDVVCNIGGHVFGDCSTVTNSEYAVVAGVPVAVAGAGYYFALLILAASMVTYDDKRLRKLFIVIASLGLLGSLWFVYLQLFVLNSICVYCMVSAVTTTLLLLVALVDHRLVYKSSGVV